MISKILTNREGRVPVSGDQCSPARCDLRVGSPHRKYLEYVIFAGFYGQYNENDKTHQLLKPILGSPPSTKIFEAEKDIYELRV